ATSTHPTPEYLPPPKTPVQTPTQHQSACCPRHNAGWALGMALLAAALWLLAPHELPHDSPGLLSFVTADEVETISLVDKGTTPPRPTPAIHQPATSLFGMET